MKYGPGNIPKGFTEFWRFYPKKLGKGQALKAWEKNQCEPIYEEIVKSLKKYPFTDEKQYIKHPSTWLNAWCWEDVFEEEDSNGDW